MSGALPRVTYVLACTLLAAGGVFSRGGPTVDIAFKESDGAASDDGAHENP